MFSRKYKKQSKLKRLLLKILNIYGIDKETFNLVRPNYRNDSKNIFALNDKSIILSNGYLDLDRKINKIDIFFRYAPNNQLWNSTDRWKRIIPNINKHDLILTCLKSLKVSIANFLKNNDINFEINCISDESDNLFDKKITEILEFKNINVKFIKSKVKGNRGTYLECCDQAEHSEDLIFFIEDDYLFEPNCIEEMIYSYSRLSTIFKEDLFLCPSDYPFYYDSNYETSLFIGYEQRWRIVYETLLTFLFSKKILNKFRKQIRQVGDQENNPFEKPLHNIYKIAPCMSPVGSLSHHISRGIPAVTENWLKVWQTNATKYKL